MATEKISKTQEELKRIALDWITHIIIISELYKALLNHDSNREGDFVDTTIPDGFFIQLSQLGDIARQDSILEEDLSQIVFFALQNIDRQKDTTVSITWLHILIKYWDEIFSSFSNPTTQFSSHKPNF